VQRGSLDNDFNCLASENSFRSAGRNCRLGQEAIHCLLSVTVSELVFGQRHHAGAAADDLSAVAPAACDTTWSAKKRAVAILAW